MVNLFIIFLNFFIFRKYSIFDLIYKRLVENAMGNIGRNSSGWANQFFNSSLKTYFEIDNSFLLRKLKHLFLPFLSKNTIRNDQNQGYDVEVPEEVSIFKIDLYIPLMSFVTYILLTCMNMGLQEKFEPDFIFKNITNCSLLTFFETVILKIGLIVADDHNIGFLDMMALAGYKYVG
jgi:protein transport protein YIF1